MLPVRCTHDTKSNILPGDLYACESKLAFPIGGSIAKDAFVEGIYEGREWVTVDGRFKEQSIEAVKEQQTQIDSLKERISKLE